MNSAGFLDHSLRSSSGWSHSPGLGPDSQIETLVKRAKEHTHSYELPKAGDVADVQGMKADYPVVLINAGDGVSILIPKEGDKGHIQMKRGQPLYLGDESGSDKAQRVYVIDAKTRELSEEVISTRSFVPAFFKDLGKGHLSEPSNLSGIAQIAASTRDIPEVSAEVDRMIHSQEIIEVFAAAKSQPELIGEISELAVLRGGEPDKGLQNGFGFVSIGGIGTGILRYITAAKELAMAERIHDVGGAQIAKIRRLRGVFEVGSTIVGGTLRTLNTPQLATVAVVSQVALSTLSKLAGVLGAAYGVLVVTPIVWNGMKSSEFISNLESVMQDGTDKEKVANGLRHLINQLVLSDEEKDEVKNTVIPKDMGKLYEMVSEKVVLHKDEAEILTHDDRTEIQKYVESVIKGLSDKDLYSLISNWGQVQNNLTIRLMKEWAQHKMVRKAKYLRRASGESYELLKRELVRPECYRLMNRLNDAQMLAKAQKIIDVARDEAQVNKKVAIFLAATFALGLTSMALVSIFSGGAPIVIALVLSLISTLMGTGLDLVAFANELQGMKDSGPKDRLILLAFAMVAVFATVMGVIEAGGVVPLVVIIIGGMIMVSMHAAAISASYQAEAAARKRRAAEEQERKDFGGYTRKELEMFE